MLDILDFVQFSNWDSRSHVLWSTDFLNKDHFQLATCLFYIRKPLACSPFTNHHTYICRAYHWFIIRGNHQGNALIPIVLMPLVYAWLMVITHLPYYAHLPKRKLEVIAPTPIQILLLSVVHLSPPFTDLQNSRNVFCWGVCIMSGMTQSCVRPNPFSDWLVYCVSFL